MAPLVRVERDGPVYEVVLSRPDRLNALTADMVAQLHAALDQVGDARALLLWGEGRAFSAGRDLSEAQPGEEDAARVLRELFHPLFLRLYRCPIPTVAAVQGACLGAGLGLAFACDVVIAAEDAFFASPFGRIGAVLDSGGHYHFVRLLGLKRAMDLIYSGRRITGKEAEAMGLVSRAVPADELLPTARQLAQSIARGPTLAFRLSKRIAQAAVTADYADVLDMEADAQGIISRSHDYTEGVRAFLEKREPSFRGA
ncbi:MAG: enoyl-CoA hydratase-related protein [Dehalococcoidia bacterium]|nr:enoyl-CoA hydratase-related protein [Dehalococcoidia bacterium]